jgi:ABC-type glycerol-3-phosphate transport system permease component
MEESITTPAKGPRVQILSSLSARRRVMTAVVVVVIAVYAMVTLVPFYFLAVRTFVSTRAATQLWFKPPPYDELHMEADIGNFSVFYNLDILAFKEHFGIPRAEYINPKWTFERISEHYGIPEEQIKSYLSPWIKYNGWMVLFGAKQFLPSFFRTLALTVFGLLGLNILSILTATGLAGLRTRFQRGVFFLYVAQIVLPPFLILLPQFMLIQGILKLIPGYEDFGSLTRKLAQLGGMLLLYWHGGALATMIYTAFISSIPREMEESAEIDGASRWQYIRYIQLPLLKVPVASFTVISLPWIWNDFLWPFVYLDNTNTTLLVLVQNMVGQYTINFRVIYSGVLVAVVPLLLVYILFRRWFVEGVMSGAIKG